MDVVDGTEAKPAETSPADEKQAWKKRDNAAFSLLTHALDELILPHIMSCVTSKEV